MPWVTPRAGTSVLRVQRVTLGRTARPCARPLCAVVRAPSGSILPITIYRRRRDFGAVCLSPPMHRLGFAAGAVRLRNNVPSAALRLLGPRPDRTARGRSVRLGQAVRSMARLYGPWPGCTARGQAVWPATGLHGPRPGCTARGRVDARPKAGSEPPVGLPQSVSRRRPSFTGHVRYGILSVECRRRLASGPVGGGPDGREKGK